ACIASPPAPSRSSRTVLPVSASMSRSESRHGQPRYPARRRPTVVLPAPINPTRTMWRTSRAGTSDMIGRVAPRRAPYTRAVGTVGPILPPAVIGILGGGQLGRMLALAARAMGYRIAILDPDPECPAAS